MVLSISYGTVDKTSIWDTYSVKLDVPMYSMGVDIIPLIMGRKEYTPTLIPASVMEAGWEKHSDRVHQSSCLLSTGRKECRGTLFPA